MNRPGGNPGGGGGATFYNVGMQLSEEMINQLTVEHATECRGLYKQVVSMREELARCGELMQGFVDREKAITEMLKALQKSFGDMTAGLGDIHGKFGDMTNHGM